LPPGVVKEAKHSSDVTLEERHSGRERKKTEERDCDSHWLAAQLRIYP